MKITRIKSIDSDWRAGQHMYETSVDVWYTGVTL